MYIICLLSHNLAFYVIILNFYLTVYTYNYGLVICTLFAFYLMI